MTRVVAGALAAAAVLWAAAVLTSPLAATRGGSRAAACAAVVYAAGSRICHQRPERSFHLAGVQLPVCARCLGLYVSSAVAALAFVLVPAQRRMAPTAIDSRVVLAVAALPTLLTVGLEWIQIAHPSNLARAAAALPLGAAAGWIVLRSLWTEKPASVRVPV